MRNVPYVINKSSCIRMTITLENYLEYLIWKFVYNKLRLSKKKKNKKQQCYNMVSYKVPSRNKNN